MNISMLFLLTGLLMTVIVVLMIRVFFLSLQLSESQEDTRLLRARLADSDALTDNLQSRVNTLSSELHTCQRALTSRHSGKPLRLEYLIETEAHHGTGWMKRGGQHG